MLCLLSSSASVHSSAYHQRSRPRWHGIVRGEHLHHFRQLQHVGLDIRRQFGTVRQLIQQPFSASFSQNAGKLCRLFGDPQIEAIIDPHKQLRISGMQNKFKMVFNISSICTVSHNLTCPNYTMIKLKNKFNLTCHVIQ